MSRAYVILIQDLRECHIRDAGQICKRTGGEHQGRDDEMGVPPEAAHGNQPESERAIPVYLRDLKKSGDGETGQGDAHQG